MRETTLPDRSLDQRLARRLEALRRERGWSLDELARRSGVSRATLSRLEKAEVSATASVLGRLCAAHGLPLSRLIQLVEPDVAPLLRRDEQPLWSDPESGFRRRSVSPPSESLAGEVLEGALPPATRLAYPQPPRAGQEHHLVLLEGCLAVSLDETCHELRPGDCLRYRLQGASAFETPPEEGARYLLFLL